MKTKSVTSMGSLHPILFFAVHVCGGIIFLHFYLFVAFLQL